MTTAKRKICLFLAALLLIPLLFFDMQIGFAASDVVFTVVNNVLLHTVTDEDMAYIKDGEAYVPYEDMMRMPGLNFYYNKDLHQLSIYRSDNLLVFDLSGLSTFDELKNTYSLYGTEKNDTVYIPVSLVCKKFNLYYSLITISALGPVVRINSERPSYSDSVLIEVMAPSMSAIYSEYTQWKDAQEASSPIPSGTSTPSTPSVPDNPSSDFIPVKQLAFPVFVGNPSGQGDDVLETLDRYYGKGTFFLSPDQIIQNADFVRAMISAGHSVGLYLEKQDIPRLSEALNNGNQVLKSILRMQTRLVYLNPGVTLTEEQQDELTSEGYLLWQGNLFPLTEKTDLGVSSRRSEYLSQIEGSLVPVFDYSQKSDTLLAAFLFDFLKGDYFMSSIHEWDTPINLLLELS